MGSFIGVLSLLVLAGAFVGAQMLRGVPSATVQRVLPAKATSSGPKPHLPWPSSGGAAVSIEGYGSLGSLRGGVVTPLAGLTKLVTALVVLHDHPLALRASGPEITVTPADVATFRADFATKQSVLLVKAGEKLSELQALEGLLIPSANNIASLLATWDAGSIPAFVSKMNAMASSMGLSAAHFVGPSGLKTGSVGTATDMVKLGEAALKSPVLAAIVDLPQVALPGVKTAINLDYDVGHYGIIGLQTGLNTRSGGNFLFAARRNVHGHTLTVVGDVLGQGGVSPIETALTKGEALANAAFGSLQRVTVLRAGTVVARLKAPWGPTAEVKTSRTVTFLGLPGEVATLEAKLGPALAPARLSALRAGEKVGTVKVDLAGKIAQTPVVAAGTLGRPSLSYRLERI